VTSSRSSAASRSAGDARRRGGLAVEAQRDPVRAQREVGRDAARVALQQRRDLAPQRPVDEQAVDEDDRRALAGVAIADGPLRNGDLGHGVLAVL
jgi:hypothetical protein